MVVEETIDEDILIAKNLADSLANVLPNDKYNIILEGNWVRIRGIPQTYWERLFDESYNLKNQLVIKCYTGDIDIEIGNASWGRFYDQIKHYLEQIPQKINVKYTILKEDLG